MKLGYWLLVSGCWLLAIFCYGGILQTKELKKAVNDLRLSARGQLRVAGDQQPVASRQKIDFAALIRCKLFGI